MSKAICCGAALSFGALAASDAAGQGIERQFSVAAGGQLVVVAEGAKIDVRGGSDIVSVSIRRGDDDAAHIEEDYDVNFDLSAQTLRVSVERRSPEWAGWLRGQRRLSIELETPRLFNVDLKTSGGKVRVAELEGAASVKTSGGTLRFENVDGAVTGRTSGGSVRLLGAASSVDLKTSGGSIAVEAVRGSARLRTSGGTIDIDRAEGAVYAKTSGGSINAAFTGQPSAASELTTSGGSVRVGVAPEVGLDVDARTQGGGVGVGDELMFSGDYARRSLNGSVNGGGAGLTVRTSGGSIRLFSL